MRIRRRAAADKAEVVSGGDLVPRTGGDKHRIVFLDVAGIAIDLHNAVAFEDEVKLLGQLVVVPLRGTAGRYDGR